MGEMFIPSSSPDWGRAACFLGNSRSSSTSFEGLSFCHNRSSQSGPVCADVPAAVSQGGKSSERKFEEHLRIAVIFLLFLHKGQIT